MKLSNAVLSLGILGLLFLAGCAVLRDGTPASGRREPELRSGFAETVSLVMDSATALVGVRTFEQPAYESLRKDGAFELRWYPGMFIATTTASGDARGGEAFGRLFRYIGGSNEAKRKIAMTAPAIREETDEGTRMTFILPSRLSLEKAPAPTDPRISMEPLRAARYATVRFRGTLSREAVEEKAEELRKWIDDQGWIAIGEPMAAGYDPPFTLPMLRRNEVWYRVLDAS